MSIASAMNILRILETLSSRRSTRCEATTTRSAGRLYCSRPENCVGNVSKSIVCSGPGHCSGWKVFSIRCNNDTIESVGLFSQWDTMEFHFTALTGDIFSSLPFNSRFANVNRLIAFLRSCYYSQLSSLAVRQPQACTSPCRTSGYSIKKGNVSAVKLPQIWIQ